MLPIVPSQPGAPRASAPSPDLRLWNPDLRLAPSQAGHGVMVSGEIDLSSVASLRTAVAAACRQDSVQCATFLLDLEGVTFLDSAGVHELAVIQRVVRERGWDLQVIPPIAPGPRRLIRFAEERGWLPRSAAFAGSAEQA